MTTIGTKPRVTSLASQRLVPGRPAGEAGLSVGRRRFTRIALLGSAATLPGVGLPTARARAAGEADALLLGCIDFRLIDKTERYMVSRGFRGKYDYVILAGASLGVLTEKYPAWGRTFWEHLDIAIQLHKIHKVLVMDHRDCGAYKMILGGDLGGEPAREKTVHAAKLKELDGRIKGKYPKLAVELLLMSLDGTVEAIV